MRLSAVAVFTSIAVLSVLQYRWSVISGEKIINDLANSYEIRIFGALAQEISQIELFNLRPPRSIKPEKNEIIESISYMADEFRDLYGNSYIISLNYSLKNNGTTMTSFDGKNWVKRSLPEFLQSAKVLEDNFRDNFALRDPEQEGTVYLITQYRDSNIISFIHFRMNEFMKNVVVPKLNTDMESDEISVTTEKTNKSIELNHENYRFSPIQTLFRFIAAQKTQYYISIPYLRSPVLRTARDIMKKPPEESKSDDFYLSVKSQSTRSLFFDRELSITVQWLTGALLLLGIGIAYLLILYQKNKLILLRRKEKEFVATVSHELRTPLTVIHSAADNIYSGILNKNRIIQYGDLIKKQSKRLSIMIEGILLFSRIEGKAEQHPILKETDLNSISHEVVTFFHSLDGSSLKKLKLDFTSLPEKVVSDRETILLMLINLTANAYLHAYSPEGKGEIRLIGHLRHPSTLVFEVEDDGKGIIKKEQKYLYDPFFRGERSLKEQVKGSGLGLFLVSRKVKLLGGSIQVESPYERLDGKTREGTRFTVTLPLRDKL